MWAVWRRTLEIALVALEVVGVLPPSKLLLLRRLHVITTPHFSRTLILLYWVSLLLLLHLLLLLILLVLCLLPHPLLLRKFLLPADVSGVPHRIRRQLARALDPDSQLLQKHA